MKIRLINTGLDKKSPPINLAHLAANLNQHGFGEVKIIDPTFYRRSYIKEVKGLDLVGISAITKYYKKACGIAREIKEHAGNPIIIGGVHISSAPLSLCPDFDVGVSIIF